MKYVELQVTSNFSFRRGGSHPEELVDHAADLGYEAIAITDRNTFAGIVRAYAVAKERGIRFIPACRIDLLDGPSLLAYPGNKEAYCRLSALLTRGNLRSGEKGKCDLRKKDVYEFVTGTFFIIVPPAQINDDFEFELVFKNNVREYRENIPNLYIAATRYYTGDDNKRLFLLSELGLPMVATNDVHYHDPDRRELQDIVTCIREKCTIFTAGYKLHQNAERFLKPIPEMERLFRSYPEALENALKIAADCSFDLKSLQFVYPQELTTEGRTPQQQLEMLTWKGARAFYGDEIPALVIEKIQEELPVIEETNNANYFLTVEDYVTEAKNRGILCQGRGSAANSAVCFCLGITSVKPHRGMLFGRFLSVERNEPPDIDVDFEHERREEIMQYVYQRFGRDRAAILPTVTVLHYKGAVRDVGRAMGLSKDTIDKLAEAFGDFNEEDIDAKQLLEYGLNLKEPHLLKVLELTGELIGFPRQLGQHTGGFVITEGQLSDLCPIFHARMENRTNIEWNKDDIDALGFMKVDILSLGMLTCIRKAFTLCKEFYGVDLNLATVPEDDPDVYAMITAADTLGVFQVESRAQMSMLPRMKPNCFYDLVIEVALVRPGPIQGDMVHPYIRRRNGEEPIDYPSDEIRAILERTLGVPLFQEQAMELAIVAAGFTPGEADLLRRSMATFKFNGLVTKFEHKLINGMVSRGYTKEYAERIFRQLEGFGSYGFPESHAIAFAHLVYVSCWLKYHYPEVFAVALLNSQPMGFYHPDQIVRNAREHGVAVLPIDMNHSYWDNTLEEKQGKYFAMRLGFRQIKGIREADMDKLIVGRIKRYERPHQLCDAGVTVATLERLANADAFRSIGLDRRQAMWEVSALKDRPIGVFEGQPSESDFEPQIQLPLMRLSEHVVQDYAATGLTIKPHILTFIREKLSLLKAKTIKDGNESTNGFFVKIAGRVINRQRPGTAKGVCFITLEDETGSANLVVFPKLFDKYRKEILGSRVLMVEGKVERTETVHIILQRCWNVTKLLGSLTDTMGEELPIMTPASSDDTSGLYIADDPRGKAKAMAPNDYLDNGRNFK